MKAIKILCGILVVLVVFVSVLTTHHIITIKQLLKLKLADVEYRGRTIAYQHFMQGGPKELEIEERDSLGSTGNIVNSNRINRLGWPIWIYQYDSHTRPWYLIGVDDKEEANVFMNAYNSRMKRLSSRKEPTEPVDQGQEE